MSDRFEHAAGPSLAALILVLAAMMSGCGRLTQTSTTAEEAHAGSSTANVARMDGKGNLTGAFHGPAPSQLMQDERGTWLQTPGEGGVITFDPATGKAYIWTPKDAEIESVSVTPDPRPGQPKLEIKGLKANLSPVVAERTKQLEAAMTTFGQLSDNERQARIEAMKQAVEGGKAVTEAFIEAFSP